METRYRASANSKSLLIIQGRVGRKESEEQTATLYKDSIVQSFPKVTHYKSGCSNIVPTSINKDESENNIYVRLTTLQICWRVNKDTYITNLLEYVVK